MAGTGIMKVPALETPFLISLNISHNSIQTLNEDILNKGKENLGTVYETTNTFGHFGQFINAILTL